MYSSSERGRKLDSTALSSGVAAPDTSRGISTAAADSDGMVCDMSCSKTPLMKASQPRAAVYRIRATVSSVKRRRGRSFRERLKACEEKRDRRPLRLRAAVSARQSGNLARAFGGGELEPRGRAFELR